MLEGTTESQDYYHERVQTSITTNNFVLLEYDRRKSFDLNYKSNLGVYPLTGAHLKC